MEFQKVPQGQSVAGLMARKATEAERHLILPQRAWTRR
jgi:hypothetical protein